MTLITFTHSILIKSTNLSDQSYVLYLLLYHYISNLERFVIGAFMVKPERFKLLQGSIPLQTIKNAQQKCGQKYVVHT